MNKEQKTSKTTEPAIAVDTVLCPVDLFRYFIRKLYKAVIKFSPDDISQVF